MGSRRLSSIVDNGATNYDAPRGAQYEGAQLAELMHHHRSSLSYPVPPHSSVPPTASFGQQPSPSIPQLNTSFAQQSRRQSLVSPATYPPPPVQPGTIYEQRPSYYQAPQTASSAYSYDRPHDSYYPQPAYPGSGYENSYSDIRFHQHVGLDQNAFNRKRRGNLPKEATNVLKEWFALNRASPYPTEDQKIELCTRTGLSLNQVRAQSSLALLVQALDITTPATSAFQCQCAIWVLRAVFAAARLAVALAHHHRSGIRRGLSYYAC